VGVTVVIYHVVYGTFIFTYAADVWWFNKSLQGVWGWFMDYVNGWGPTLYEVSWIAIPLDYVEQFGLSMGSSGKFHPSNEGFTTFFFIICWPSLWYWSSTNALKRLVEIPWIILFYLINKDLFVD